MQDITPMFFHTKSNHDTRKHHNTGGQVEGSLQTTSDSCPRTVSLQGLCVSHSRVASIGKSALVG